MGPIRGLIGALAGGAIGAGIWAAVTYNMHMEIGWIAWGVGGLTGLGAALAARDKADHLTGIIAAVVAVVAVLVGKYAAVHMMVNELAPKDSAMTVSDEDAQVYLADRLVEEYEGAGKKLQWPAGMTAEEAAEAKDYPPDLWKDAQSRWTGLGDGGQAEFKEQIRASMVGALASIRSEVEKEGFMASFSAFDILFFLLAVATAFKLGSGMGGE